MVKWLTYKICIKGSLYEKKILFFMPERQSWWLYLLRSQCRWAGFKRSRYYWRRQPSPSWNSARSSNVLKSQSHQSQATTQHQQMWSNQPVVPASKSRLQKVGFICRESYRASTTEKEETLFRLIQEGRPSLTPVFTLLLVVQQMRRCNQNHSLMWVATTEILVLATTVP